MAVPDVTHPRVADSASKSEYSQQPDVIHTSNPIHDYEFSWTIEHFSFSPDVLRGPSIAPIPGFLEHLCLKLQYTRNQINRISTFNVFLSDLNAMDSRRVVVSSNTTLRNSIGKIYKEHSVSNAKFYGTICLLSFSFGQLPWQRSLLETSEIVNLLNDKLVVKGKISFAGFHIVTSVFSSLKDQFDILKDLKTMYESGIFADVTFEIGGKTLRAHKIILHSRSPVFARMFDNDMLESNSSRVVIKDTDSHAFNCFLLFLYTGVVEDKTLGTVISLYSLAHKYQVEGLHGICSRMLSHGLGVDSVFNLLVLSDLHGDKELREAAKAFIRCHLSQLAATTDWAEMVLTRPQLMNEIMPPTAP